MDCKNKQLKKIHSEISEVYGEAFLKMYD